jgi:hypothetical protein
MLQSQTWRTVVVWLFREGIAVRRIGLGKVPALALPHLARLMAARLISAVPGTTTRGIRCVKHIPGRAWFASSLSSIGSVSSAAGSTFFKSLMKERRAAAHV